MRARKSKFLTFCFSMLPGAGHMYLGFMKQGLSIMTMFFGLCAFATITQLGAVLFLIPILWFYSFFDVINKNSLGDNEFYSIEDSYLLGLDFDLNVVTNLLRGRFRVAFALILIFMGGFILFDNFLDSIYQFIPDRLYWTFREGMRRLPQIVIAFGIILAGCHLISGKKKELLLLEDKERQDDGTSAQTGWKDNDSEQKGVR